MSDTTPTPEDPDRAVAQPAAQPVEQPAAQPAVDPAYLQQGAQSRPSGTRWWTSRAPLLAIAAALLVGCLVGGGIVAVGAFVFGDHRGYSSFDQRRGGPGRPDWGRMPRGERWGPPGQRVPAPANPATPAPTAS